MQLRSDFLRWVCGVTASIFAVLGASAAEPAVAVAVQFSVFSVQPIRDLSFIPRANTAPVKVVFQPTARSVRQEFRGAGPLRFVDATTGDVVAEAVIPPTIRDALLLFSPLDAKASAGTKLRYQIAVLDDGAGRHGPGGLAIINLSGLALAGTVGAEKVTVKAGLNPTLAIGRSAAVTLTTTFKGRTYQSYAATVTLGRNERALLILFPPFNSGSLEVQPRLLVDQPPGSAAAGR
ncbi:MAG: hypothetical protein JNL92_01220 [Opitutaceae bacterium]|nr:hypothetical protein [Opitutaceae bacterium]